MAAAEVKLSQAEIDDAKQVFTAMDHDGSGKHNLGRTVCLLNLFRRIERRRGCRRFTRVGSTLHTRAC